MALKRIEGVTKEEDRPETPHRQRLPVCQQRVCAAFVRQRHTRQHDRERRPEKERPGRTHERHGEERVVQRPKFCSVTEVRAAMRNAVTFYNYERPHMSIGMMTPAEATNCAGELERM